ncbi:MAG: hypothetical protein KKH68_14820, partial [Proteobacteria bacterium]|nr:hypothetical protein [Pseudomonadota bacterium]
GKLIAPFNDLRSGHEVGLFVAKPYRNKGARGIWNLDEILMVVALEAACEHGVLVFTIRPTGDRTRYYRQKFGAKIQPTTGTESMLAIDSIAFRKTSKHIEFFGKGGKTHYFRVKGGADNALVG